MECTFLKSVIAGLTAFSMAGSAAANALCAEDAMLVFDGSTSMSERTYGTVRGSRIAAARNAIAAAMPEVTPYRDVGLMVYGPGGPDGCNGINLAFAPTRDSAGQIISTLGGVRPSGMTPLAAAIEFAADVMDYERQPAVIVVVTDGYESCGGSPCKMAQQLSERSAGLRIHVVGFNLPNESLGWTGGETTRPGARCVAENTGGMFVEARNTEDLVGALNATLGCMLVAGREAFTLPG